MDIRTFDVCGPVAITPRKLGDERGYFTELFREDLFTAALGSKIDFVQDNQSLSARVGTVRGLHFQTNPMGQGKLVRCIAGAIFDVAVDLRVDSPTFSKWIGIELTAEACNQLWIPVGFAHGFCTLLPNTVVAYRVTNYYSPEHDNGVAWNDSAIGIDWPAQADSETLSGKDRLLPLLADLPACFSMKD